MTSAWNLHVLRDLFRHMEWADERVWEAVAQLPAGPADERLRTLLLHIHIVQRAFLHIWTERPVLFPKEEEFPSILDVRVWARPYYAELAAFVDALPVERLAEPLQMPWVKELEARIGRAPEKPTIAETMFQVTSHSTYHRGQANVRLRELGLEPPLVDYIAWIWFGRPAHNKTAVSGV